MFGDYFSQRGDYSTGLAYSCHYRYLNDHTKGSLEAPDEFKSRRALKSIRESNLHKREDKNSYNVQFKRRNKFKNAANLLMNVMNFENSAADILRMKQEEELNRSWIPKFEAGVQFWVNKKTGDVRPFPPSTTYAETLQSRSFKEKPSFSGHLFDWDQVLDTETLGDGTGSLVYDDREMQDFWKLMDSVN